MSRGQFTLDERYNVLQEVIFGGLGLVVLTSFLIRCFVSWEWIASIGRTVLLLVLVGFALALVLGTWWVNDARQIMGSSMATLFVGVTAVTMVVWTWQG